MYLFPESVYGWHYTFSHFSCSWSNKTFCEPWSESTLPPRVLQMDRHTAVAIPPESLTELLFSFSKALQETSLDLQRVIECTSTGRAYRAISNYVNIKRKVGSLSEFTWTPNVITVECRSWCSTCITSSPKQCLQSSGLRWLRPTQCSILKSYSCIFSCNPLIWPLEFSSQQQCSDICQNV